MTVLLAHVGGGHWWEILIYTAPVIVMAVALGLQVLGERRRGRRDEDAPGEGKRPE